MRKLFFMFAIVATLFAVGCQKYNDKPLKNRVIELENRVTTLEELCKKMNTNISSLQTIVGALQNNDYVTGDCSCNQQRRNDWLYDYFRQKFTYHDLPR